MQVCRRNCTPRGQLFERHRGVTHLYEGASKNKVWCASSAAHAGCCIGLHQSQNKVLGNRPFVTPHYTTLHYTTLHYTNICKFPAVCNGSANCRCLGTQTNEERQTVDRTSLSLHSQSSQSHMMFPCRQGNRLQPAHTPHTHTNGHTLFRADTHRSDPSPRLYHSRAATALHCVSARVAMHFSSEVFGCT